MKASVLAIVLSTAALAGVAAQALILQGRNAEPAARETSAVERGPEAYVPPPPRLEGPASSSPADAAAFEARLAALEKQVATLQSELEAAKKILDPAREVLELIAQEAPRFRRARLAANETAAIATLRNIVSAQAQFQQSCKADTDNDGAGEYGGFAELSGAVAGRMSRPLIPPVLSSAFRVLTGHGEARRSGYLFRIYLPDDRGRGLPEGPNGFARSQGIEPDLAETTWCVYAWPATPGGRERPTFFTNQGGDVFKAVDDRYVGEGRGPEADAAFAEAGILSRAAHGDRGRDGNEWTQVN